MQELVSCTDMLCKYTYLKIFYIWKYANYFHQQVKYTSAPHRLWNPPTKVVGTKHIAHNVQATAVKRRHWPDNPEHEGPIRSTRSKQWLVHRVPRKGCNQQDHVSPALLGQKQSHITCIVGQKQSHITCITSPIFPALLWQNQSHITCTAMAKSVP